MMKPCATCNQYAALDAETGLYAHLTPTLYGPEHTRDARGDRDRDRLAPVIRLQFLEQPDGSVVCSHRDTTVCPSCQAAYPDLRNVYGAFFLMSNEDYAAMLRRLERD